LDFPIGTIASQASATLKFKAIAAVEPENMQFVNQASIEFQFTFPDGRTLGGSAVSNLVAITVTEHEE